MHYLNPNQMKPISARNAPTDINSLMI